MSAPTTEVRHLTIKDLAARLGVSEQAVRHHRMRGYGPPSFSVGRLVRYRLADVEAWEAAQLEAEADR